MYWQLPWWKWALFLLPLTTQPRLYRQKGQTCWRQSTNHHHAPLFGVSLKGGDSLLSASIISPLRLRNQVIRASNWILMDRPWRPVLSAYWATIQSPETEKGGLIVDRLSLTRVLHGGFPAGSHTGNHTFRFAIESLLLSGKSKNSPASLQPPTACHLELPVKTMAAYWFTLAFTFPHPISGSGLTQRGDSRLRISRQVLHVSSHSHKNNHVLCFLKYLWLFDQWNICHCCCVVSPSN